MGYEFDGVNKIIKLTAGTTSLDVKDLYSRWKNWQQNGGTKFHQAMNAIGGDPIDEPTGIYVTSYVFLENGWKVRPQEANHKLKVQNGVLLTMSGEDPFIPTIGDYNVLVQYSQPIKSESTVIETGTSGLTPEESQKLAAIEAATAFIKAVESGRWKVENNQMIFFGPDNETELVRFNLFDKRGRPSEENVYERKRC